MKGKFILKFMRIVRAKGYKNKLEVFDNRPFSIDVELQKEGFKVMFFDLKNGEMSICYYATRELFDKEWRLCENINEEDIFYGEELKWKKEEI